MANTKPILLLAFANDEAHSLRELAREHDELREALRLVERDGKCELLSLTAATPAKIIQSFHEHHGRIRVFHYGGHSDADSLFLHRDYPGQDGARAEGLAAFLAAQPGLELVFLNGCLSLPQAEAYHHAGARAVIATDRPIEDAAARAFAGLFYGALAGGKTVGEAFRSAEGAFRTQHGELWRGIDPAWPGGGERRRGAPWRLFPVGVEGWKIPERERQPTLVADGQAIFIRKQLTFFPALNYRVFGRETAVEELEGRIRKDPGKIMVVEGMGGIGKSTLVKSWYQVYGDRYVHKGWIDVTSALDVAFVTNEELINALFLSRDIKSLPEAERAFHGFALVLGRLRELEGPNLLVIDNALEDLERPAFVNRLANLLPDWTIIVTSRVRFSGSLFDCDELALLDEGDALALFKSMYDPVRERDFQLLLQVVPPHPLTMELLAKSLYFSTDVKDVRQLADYLKSFKLEDELKDTIVSLSSSEEEADLYAHLAKTFTLLNVSDYARWLLIQFAVVPPLAVRDYHLQILLQVPEPDRRRFNESLNTLHKSGWLSGDLRNRTFFLHHLLQMVVGVQTQPKLADCDNLVDSFFRIYEDRLLDHFIPFFSKAHQSRLEDDYNLLRRYFDRFHQLDVMLEYLIDRLPDLEEHPRYFRLLRSAAHSYKNTGRFTSALSLYKRYMEAAFEHDEDSIPFAIDAFEFIIDTLLDQSSQKSLQEADGWLEDMEAYISKHQDTGFSNRGLFCQLKGKFCRIIGHYQEARQYYQEVLEIVEAATPPNEKNIAAAQSNLATVCQDLGEYARARILLEAALASAMKNFGPDHPNVAVRQSNLALVYKDLGEYGHARDLLEAALASDLKNFGPDHPTVAVSHNNLAHVLVAEE